jgi:hypothetical protein
MKNKNATLVVSFPLTDDWRRREKQIDKLVKKFKGRSCGSGAGFGVRDLDYVFEAEEAARDFAKAAKDRFSGIGIAFWSESLKY